MRVFVDCRQCSGFEFVLRFMIVTLSFNVNSYYFFGILTFKEGERFAVLFGLLFEVDSSHLNTIFISSV